MAHRLWTEDEMILALSVYFQLPFGRLQGAAFLENAFRIQTNANLQKCKTILRNKTTTI